MVNGISWRYALLLAVLVGGMIAALLADPIAQDPAYHLFADRRSLFGIPNFLDVVSNTPFALVGAVGLYFVSLDAATASNNRAWRVFFVGVFLTAFGSGYYHLAPDNDTLVWDRLPMTIAFMGFVSIVVGEYLSEPLAKRLLLPLLVVGAASVFYWAHTEALGRGDLRAYALVQFLPMLLIPMVVLLYRDRSDLGPYVGWMILFYMAAKLLEFFDVAVFAAGGIVSGHSLKHVFAAMAPASLLYGLRQRRYHAARRLTL